MVYIKPSNFVYILILSFFSCFVCCGQKSARNKSDIINNLYSNVAKRVKTNVSYIDSNVALKLLEL